MQSRRSHLGAALLTSLVFGSFSCADPPTETTGGAGGMGGVGGSGGAMCIPVDDLNECTDDVCNVDGVAEHIVKAVGSPCSKSGTLCDGNGKCVECLAVDDCPGTDNACQTRTCTEGSCGKDFKANGTPLPTQKDGDCKVQVCDGNGSIIATTDDNDNPDDSNACTADACDQGTPSNTNVDAGTNCGTNGTGNPLVCDSKGQCVGCNAASDCPGVDDECSKRTCNAGVCGVEFTPTNTPIAAQTAQDCLAQVCDGAGKIVNIPDNADIPGDDGNPCTSESCAGGMPMHPNEANGSVCNDGNACTMLDTCQAGVCTGGNTITCVASDQCHVAGTCNPATGMCSNPEKPNGAACTDNNTCTQSDTCQAGACVGSNPVQCAASDACHDAGTCNPATGVCSNPAKADGAACDDNNACTQSDTCQAGTCTGANPVTCATPDQCHLAGTCNPATGMCSNPAKPNGATCNDNNACTQSDTCQAGTCTGTSPVICAASDQCHTAGTCNTMTGQCSNPNAPNGTMCTLGGSGGVCSVGACTLCGNGIINAGEQCDDNNSVGGDGCSTTCQYEEIEGNNNCSIADPIVLSGTPLSGSITGAITPVGDQDWSSFTITGPNPRSVRIETFVGGPGMCTAATGSADTVISLYAPNCTTLLGSNDEDGINSCSLIDPSKDLFARNLSAGTYKIQTIRWNNNDVINNYRVVVTFVGTCGNGVVEPGESCDDGNLATADGCNATCAIDSGYMCSGSPSMCIVPEINCNDGIDNNGNGAIDSADTSCAVPAYFSPCLAGQHLLVHPVAGPNAIPNTPATFTSNVNVVGATQIARAAMLFNVTHPYASDVDLTLTPPGGMPLNMSTGNGSFGDNFTNTLLDSTCATNISSVGPANAPFTGCYAPEASLASLNGMSANGLWRLTINDSDPAQDNGTLDNWKLILCTSP